MLREIELKDRAWTYGYDYGRANDKNYREMVESLVDVHLYNNNISPTDEQLIHLTVLATLAFVKGWKKGKRDRK